MKARHRVVVGFWRVGNFIPIYTDLAGRRLLPFYAKLRPVTFTILRPNFYRYRITLYSRRIYHTVLAGLQRARALRATYTYTQKPSFPRSGVQGSEPGSGPVHWHGAASLLLA